MRFAVPASSPIGLRGPVHLPPPLTGSRSKICGGRSYRLLFKSSRAQVLPFTSAGLRLELNAPYDVSHPTVCAPRSAPAPCRRQSVETPKDDYARPDAGKNLSPT